MKKLTSLTPFVICLCLSLTTSSVTYAASPTPAATPTAKSSPTPAPPASAAESQFVSAVTKDLQSRYATTAAATAAGYFRYTDEDETGAISWVNTGYFKSDPQHPSQLWFDVNGRLIGADWSVLQADSPSKPSVWGIDPSRWTTFRAHVHFGVKTATGLQYGGAGAKSMGLVKGSLANPTAQDVVNLAKTDRWKLLKIPAPRSVADVAFVFPFPAIWDLQIWLVPNPLGAFTEANPNVKPSVNTKPQD